MVAQVSMAVAALTSRAAAFAVVVIVAAASVLGLRQA
jgi:hypothetical protein